MDNECKLQIMMEKNEQFSIFSQIHKLPYHNFPLDRIEGVLFGTDFWAKSVNERSNLVVCSRVPDCDGRIPCQAIG